MRIDSNTTPEQLAASLRAMSDGLRAKAKELNAAADRAAEEARQRGLSGLRRALSRAVASIRAASDVAGVEESE